MRAERFPRRDEALLRLCATEPALCGDAAARTTPRRLWPLALLLLALGLFLLPAARAQSPYVKGAAKASSAAAVTKVESVGMTVSDMDASVDFYTRVLTFEKVSDVEVAGDEYERLQGLFGVRMRVVRLRLGDEMIEMTEYLAPRGRPIPVDSRSNDRWFQHFAVITSDMEKAYARLRQNRVQHASTGPQTLPAWNKNAGGIRAFYFKDPDGHALEILEFPEGKGAEKWHRLRESGRLFLGIDHTAIVVSDTEASLKFYRDVLGMTVVGGSENYGTEQEHLNNVRGARLRITSLHATGGGIGVEFLEYLAPCDGRPAPADKRANDLLHWQTGLITENTDGLAELLLRGSYSFVSDGLTALPGSALGFRRGFLVADPDGHVMRVAEY
jgi:catechol 2,3-dioxygenase-like lactoylglutathione lyase family enzyme